MAPSVCDRFFPIAKQQPLLLTIDAAYTLDHWEEKALPGFLASTVDTVRSVQKLRTYAEKHMRRSLPVMTLTLGRTSRRLPNSTRK